jgi:hypothetical protein
MDRPTGITGKLARALPQRHFSSVDMRLSN